MYIVIKEEDAVPQSPGFPIFAPQLCPQQCGDRSLPDRLESDPASSLGQACERGGSNWQGPLRASILVCLSLRKGVTRHQPLRLIFPIMLCSTVGAGKTACLPLPIEGIHFNRPLFVWNCSQVSLSLFGYWWHVRWYRKTEHIVAISGAQWQRLLWVHLMFFPRSTGYFSISPTFYSPHIL